VNPNATAVAGINGYSHTCGGHDGGQAEYVRVPFTDVGPAPTPGWLADEDPSCSLVFGTSCPPHGLLVVAGPLGVAGDGGVRCHPRGTIVGRC
jgi:threonine dehydrogenase-like Zn-dependent dehydrogenase